MKNILLIFSALAFVMLCFNGCTPDEVVTAQEQFKPFLIKVSCSEPLTPLTVDSQGLMYLNALTLSAGNYGSSSINGTGNTVGLTHVQLQGTAVANTPVNIDIDYSDIIGYQGGLVQGDCDLITLEIYFDGNLVYTEQRSMGGMNCPDYTGWIFTYTF
jgi:hypothetical protein